MCCWRPQVGLLPSRPIVYGPEPPPIGLAPSSGKRQPFPTPLRQVRPVACSYGGGWLSRPPGGSIPGVMRPIRRCQPLPQRSAGAPRSWNTALVLHQRADAEPSSSPSVRAIADRPPRTGVGALLARRGGRSAPALPPPQPPFSRKAARRSGTAAMLTAIRRASSFDMRLVTPCR